MFFCLYHEAPYDLVLYLEPQVRRFISLIVQTYGDMSWVRTMTVDFLTFCASELFAVSLWSSRRFV